jgi:conjugal transfer mating pair stabilization protein TraN
MNRFFVIVLFLLWTAPVHALICAKDLNGDGNLDFGSESATCLTVQGKDFCPIGAVDCNAESTDPTCPETGETLCPSGGTHNAAMNRCELPPAVTSWRCPATGSTYENQSSCQNACLQTGTCSQHSHQNGPYYCQTYAGGTANVCDLQYCQINGGGSAPCPPGVDPTYSNSNCPGVSLTYWGETYYWGPSDDFGCWGHWSRVWYYYNTIYHWTCSVTGAEYGDSGTCSAGCTQGTACTAMYGCPSGYQMADNVCTAPVTRQTASFNPTSHLCETTPTTSCLPGFSYDGVLDRCIGTISCPPGGAFNSQANLCQASPTLLCPAGYVNNAARGICDAEASCPAGSSYNAAADRCEADVISSYQCPTTGMNYSTQAKCQDACLQTRACVQTCPSANLSGSFNFDPAYNFMGGVWPANNGTCLDFFGRVGQGAGTICASNGVTFGEGYNSSAGSGTHWSTSVVYTQDNKICFFSNYCIPLGNAGQYRNYVTVYGASVSGGSNAGTATIVKGWGSGNDLCFQGAEQTCDEWGCGWTYAAPFCVTVTPNCYQACPLGAYPCVGGTCSSGSACSGPNYSCPSAYSLNGTACVVSPTCPAGGSLNGTTDRCEAGYSPTCPSGYSYNGARGICEASPCPPGSICRTDPGACIVDTAHQCPTVFTYNPASGLCEAQPQCVTGNFDASVNLHLGRATECPYGNQFDCLPNPANGVMQCSPNACFDPALQPTETKNADLKGLHDDAEVDRATGDCRGTIMIFNGKPSECKTAGISTSFFNCCDTDEESLGPVRERCGDGDATTVQAVGAGRCHYVGDYCKEEWWLIGCVQRANTYCCFNSKLGRIIHEQGRHQLQQFAGNGGWGGAENPNCRGFTPEEFQMLDFSRIDLSEYFGDIRTKATQEIQRNMEGKVREYYQNIR